MNIDLLLNNQAEVVSLGDMSITEYIQHLVSTDNAPATMMVNKNNGVEVRLALGTTSYDAPVNKTDGSRGQMTITINDMLTDNDVLLFRAKPKTQGVGIGEALQQLIADQMGVSAEFLGNTSCQPNTVREVECAMARSEAFWAETSQRNNLMRKASNPYRDGDWFESCKPDDHD